MLYVLSKSPYDGYLDDISTLPFSFVYDGKAYSGFPADVFIQIDHINTTHGSKESDTFVLRNGALRVTIDTAFYPGYGAYEWTVWFENTGTENSPVLSDVLNADIVFSGEDPVLKGILGDHGNQYRPYSRALNDAPVNFRSDKGRPTHIEFSYFNLDKTYELRDADAGPLGAFRSRELADGYTVNLPEPRSAALVYIIPFGK